MVELWLLLSAYCPMKFYICSKLHKNIDDRFKVIEWIHFELIIPKGHYSAKNIAGVTVLILYTSSDAALYLYQVS